MTDRDGKRNTAGDRPVIKDDLSGDGADAEANPLDAAMGKATNALSGGDTRVSGSRAISGGDTR